MICFLEMCIFRDCEGRRKNPRRNGKHTQKNLPNISHEVAGKHIWWKGCQMLNDRILFLTAGNQLDRHSFAFRVRNNVVLFWTQQKQSSLFHKFTSWEKKTNLNKHVPCFNTSAHSQKIESAPPNKTSFFQGETCGGFQAKFYKSLEPKWPLFWLEKTLFWEGPRPKIEDNVRWGVTSPIFAKWPLPQINHQSCGERSWRFSALLVFVSWLPCVFLLKVVSWLPLAVS